jgi:hypothetical protein
MPYGAMVAQCPLVPAVTRLTTLRYLLQDRCWEGVGGKFQLNGRMIFYIVVEQAA